MARRFLRSWNRRPPSASVTLCSSTTVAISVTIEGHAALGVGADEEMAQLGDRDAEIVDLLVVEPGTARRVRGREAREPEILGCCRDDERDTLVSGHEAGTITVPATT